MTNWQPYAHAAAGSLDESVVALSEQLAAGGDGGGDSATEALDAQQNDAYELAFLASEARALSAVLEAASTGSMGDSTALIGAAGLLRSARARADRLTQRSSVAPLQSPEVLALLSAGAEPERAAAAIHESADARLAGLSGDLSMVANSFRRFAEDHIAPIAQEIHRRDLDIPEPILSGLAKMGAFGLSIPSDFGGSQDSGAPDHLPMVVATEVLSEASLGAGGSLITRPEILARAVLTGGTDDQKRRWLPRIASGEHMVAVAVTEPNVGSDVASIRTQAVDDGERYLINGSKMWCTFAGRADLLMVLARTNPDPASGYRGLSLFVVEKDPTPGHTFAMSEPGGGRLSGRAIPTIGYRGMHSYEVTFEDWPVPKDALIGGAAGIGRGFHLQMDAFAAGRLQTAARAVGVMQAAADAALAHARERMVFGRPLLDHPLTTRRLAEMVVRTHTNRLFTRSVAHHLSDPRGQLEASMAKALACRAAEEITRDALQIHGGYGYAEEYAISRLFVDARVLSIFEGAEEVLALRVIARRLIGR